MHILVQNANCSNANNRGASPFQTHQCHTWRTMDEILLGKFSSAKIIIYIRLYLQ